MRLSPHYIAILSVCTLLCNGDTTTLTMSVASFVYMAAPTVVTKATTTTVKAVARRIRKTQTQRS